MILKSRKPRIAVFALILLIVIRFAVLPPVIRSVINHQINAQQDTVGHVDGVHLHLLQGGVTLTGIHIKKFFKPNWADVQIRQLSGRVNLVSLLRGHIVADAKIIGPHLELFTIDENVPFFGKPPLQASKEATKQVRRQQPFRIDLVQIRDGFVRYNNLGKSPNYAFVAEKINGEITNLVNSTKLQENLFARFDIHSILQNSGSTHLTGKFNPNRHPPEFKLNLAIKRLALEKLNPMMTAEKDVRIEHGTLDLATEVATKNGMVDGYVKPAITDLQVSNLKKDIKKGLGHALKEQALNMAGKIAENPGKGEQGTRVPFHGKIDDPKVGIGSAIGATLKNIFVQAVVPNVEHSVKLANVGK